MLADNLKASGYQPEQVDEVYVTHMHSDHIGGLVSGAQAAFPNAIVRADRREADQWLSREKISAAPEAMATVFETAIATFAPYVSAGRFRPFDGETELVPGVKAMPTRGHTPGHTAYVVESKGEKLVLGRSHARRGRAVRRADGHRAVRHR